MSDGDELFPLLFRANYRGKGEVEAVYTASLDKHSETRKILFDEQEPSIVGGQMSINFYKSINLSAIKKSRRRNLSSIKSK